MNKIRDTLIAARALIEDEERWTKGAMARDKNGAPCESGGTPVCWCASGAIMMCELKKRSADSEGAMRYLREALPPWAMRNVPQFNDNSHTTHAEVLAAFDKAIDLAKDAEVRAPGMWGWKTE